jgi:NitT/TauT family transport system ATP-binding protein
VDARPPKIVLDRVSIAFGAFTAVQDVSLAVGEHELLCIVGRSGGGKTSLLRAVGGLIPPCSGRVLLDSTEVRRPTPGIATVFQHFGLFPWKTVRANVEYGLSVQGRRDSGGTVDRLLGVMGLADHATKYPYQLSGGMQQRVGIARALAVEPEVLLLDEPFSAVDALTRETLQSELLTLWDRDQETTAATAVLVTHDIDEAILLGDRIVILDGPPGHVVRELRVPIERPRVSREIRFHPEYARLRLDVWEALQGRKDETLVRGGRRDGP